MAYINMPVMCKVKLYYSSFKYDGCCYYHCDCGCPNITIFMRRHDALYHIRAGKAEFADDDAECTPSGGCCHRAFTALGGTEAAAA